MNTITKHPIKGCIIETINLPALVRKYKTAQRHYLVNTQLDQLLVTHGILSSTANNIQSPELVGVFGFDNESAAISHCEELQAMNTYPFKWNFRSPNWPSTIPLHLQTPAINYIIQNLDRLYLNTIPDLIDLEAPQDTLKAEVELHQIPRLVLTRPQIIDDNNSEYYWRRDTVHAPFKLLEKINPEDEFEAHETEVENHKQKNIRENTITDGMSTPNFKKSTPRNTRNKKTTRVLFSFGFSKNITIQDIFSKLL